MIKKGGVVSASSTDPTSMRASIKMTGLMDTEDSFGPMAGITRACGSTTCTAVKAQKSQSKAKKGQATGKTGSTLERRSLNQK